MTSDVFAWLIAAAAIGGILIRPRNWPEVIWACSGALLLVVFRLVSLPAAGSAIGKGTDVYLFLTGMMLLAELARREGVFDWVAALAVNGCAGSRTRLFLIIYSAGVLITAFLSNDATAVVLTPAVYAAVKKAKAPAMPYLLACAFISNAASFILPISNPANLVVYGKNLPPLFQWLRIFALPSLLAVSATFVALRLYSRGDLRGGVEGANHAPELSTQGRRAVWGITVTAATLIGASAMGRDLGLPTCIAAVCTLVIASNSRKEVLRGVSWSVLPLVAGLFVIVDALNKAGGSRVCVAALEGVARLPLWQGTLAASFGVTAVSNLLNNLPAGLIAGGAVQTAHVSPQIRDAVLIGVDLGPNLSVTGSLATILWLIAIRREGEQVSGWTFLKVGVVVMPPALLLATLARAY